MLTAVTAIAPPAMAQSDAPRESVAAEIRAQVGGKFKDFYGRRGYWPLWVDGDALGPQAEALVALIDDAALDGLKPGDYDVRGLRKIIDRSKDGSPRALADADLALSKAFADFVGDMRRPSSQVDMRYLDKELQPRRETPTDILRAAAIAPSLTNYVRSMGWMSPFYVRLRAARGEYHDDWGDLPDTPVPSDVKMRPGMKSDGIAALRSRLGVKPGTTYDKVLVARVRAFQRQHGLDADGIAGAQTVALLNRGPGWYDHIVSLNLERARLLPGPWVRHVVVDAASARLYYYEDGAQQGTMRVVVGAPASQTPMMAGMVRYATLNPYWNIPSDLVERNIAPKILGGASLKKMRYEALSDWSADARTLDPATIDWSAVASGAQEVRVRQLPGAGNAMGKVKFMFPNDLGIYLHDTSSRDLLSRPVRQLSNGCVRLEDAARLGRWFFGKALKPETDTPEQHLPLPSPVPVYLTYLTAVPDEGGVTILKDVYDRDGGAGE